jgi:hypothetical protein
MGKQIARMATRRKRVLVNKGLDIMGKSWSGDLHGRKTAGSLLGPVSSAEKRPETLEVLKA